ncbi:uncharacterized protein LTR77_002950 [Saxophila tyrrhenica]|uniref:Glycoside hydrolase family 3 N-terminal domain-containing protein n=1 Tax=Saxophila tyrrhenica TaxID=1690608 RepID=A0AAV9PKG8_9PEZI|nr:hypothetical protein LTR77_002950 [Saxophila tyrrhenica]
MQLPSAAALLSLVLWSILSATTKAEATAKETTSIYDLLDSPVSWTSLSDNKLSILAGYHVIYSWPGSILPQRLLNLAEAGKVGGVIIFGENVVDGLPAQIQSLQDAYANGPAYDGTPLLVVTDQEGGEVVRLPGGPEESAKEIGSSAHPARAAASAGPTSPAAGAMAEGLIIGKGNLAPVLDVYRKEGDFDDQFERSFSKDPDIVKKCGTAFLNSQQANGVLATTKHFPGLGAADSDENTDLGPVTLDVPLKQLRSIDELPFKGAIAAGVSMVMPSWAVYPALDPKRPAGLSSKWIRAELRQRLGFKGVTISDAIEAGALEDSGSNSTRAVTAIEAGMDIALASARDVSQGKEVLDGLVAAIRDGSISGQDFAASTKRIMALRSKL